MWIAFQNGTWVEMGDMDGARYPQGTGYWAGHFYAYSNQNGYNEFTTGSNYASSGNAFKILHTSNNTWSYYLNDTFIASVNTQYDSGVYMNAGIESNDTTATFNTGIYDSALQYQTATTGWNYWATPANWDNNSLGWVSLFNGTNSTLTFSHS